jgi:phosphopantetheinyl transferase
MIYLCENVDADIRGIQLPPERMKKLLRYKRKKDRNLCAISYGLFSVGIAREYGIKTQMEWYGDGKPYTIHPPIPFNISHCDLGAVCVIDRCEVGVDIQDYASVSVEVADVVCTDAEKVEILSSPHPQKAMCRIWCLKESYAKYTGEGLGGTLPDFSGKSSDRFLHAGKHFTIFDLGDCCMALCGARFFTESDIVTMDAETAGREAS